MIHFIVTGKPMPQGSKVLQSVGGKTWLREANSEVYAWRDRIRSAARLAMKASEIGDGVVFDTAVAVQITFWFKRPKTVSKNRAYPNVKPDIDKLSRAVLDALTGVVYSDDGRVVDLMARKAYAHENITDGISVTVTPYDNSLITETKSDRMFKLNLQN